MDDIGYIEEQTIDKEDIQRIRQVFWLYVILLITSLVTLNTFFYFHQQSSLMSQFEQKNQLDLRHLGILASEAVEQNQYPFIEWYLNRWIADNPHVSNLLVTAMDGTTLIDHSNSALTSDLLSYRLDIKSNNGNTVHLSLDTNINGVDQNILHNIWGLFLSSLFISLSFSALFWFALIRKAISPIFKKLQYYQQLTDELKDKHSIQKAKRKLLKHQAGHDPLTGLVNRRTFERRLKRACKSSLEHNQEHVLMFMDLDNFKPVNDQMGHAAGDELLKRISLKIRHAVRSNDTFARIGGDEFALLLEDCSMQSDIKVAGNVCNEICNYEFHWAESTFNIGISIGVILIYQDMSNYDQVMERVDQACYEAKRLGGCQISINGRISTDH